MTTPRSFPSLALLALAAAACSADEKKAMEAPAEGGGSAATARPQSPEEARPPAPLRALSFPEVEEWVEETPDNVMRAAQYRLPAPEGAAKDATLVVFFFRGGAGGFDANLARWAGQFVQPDGRPSLEVALHSQSQIAGHPAREVELSGTYAAETFPGSGQHVNEPDWVMLAAQLEGQDGAWFFRLLGPRASVEHHRAAYRRFLASVRAGG